MGKLTTVFEFAPLECLPWFNFSISVFLVFCENYDYKLFLLQMKKILYINN